jgi:hypothetical protein
MHLSANSDARSRLWEDGGAPRPTGGVSRRRRLRPRGPSHFPYRPDPGALTPWGKGPDTQRTFIGPGAPASPPGQGLPGPGAYRNALRVSAARDLSDTAEERVGEETSLQIGHFSRRNRALTHY